MHCVVFVDEAIEGSEWLVFQLIIFAEAVRNATK